MMMGWMVKALAVAAIAGGVLIVDSRVAEAQCVARFTCSPGVSPTCWFRLFYRNGTSNVFSVRAGGERRIFGLRPGDAYCSSNRGIPGFNCAARRVRMAC